MKKFFLAASLFLTGLIVGIGIMFGVIWKGPDAVISQEAHGMVMMNVVYATLLHDQKYQELERLLETNMTCSFVSAEKLPSPYHSPSSARLVRGYYDVIGEEPPPMVGPYLAGVKGSDVRRLARAMTAMPSH